jgi:hypothetical protein
MFNVFRWTVKRGFKGFLQLVCYIPHGFIIMAIFCYLLGAKYAFYVPRLFESWSGLSPLVVGFIFGGWAGAFIASVCIAGWSRDPDFASFRDQAVVLQWTIGMVMGEALAVFMVLRSADRAMAMGVAVGFAAAIGFALDIWIMKRGIKPLENA